MPTQIMIKNLLDHPDFQSLVSLLKGKRSVVLTGAGCSTDSGIPDYRSPTALAKRGNPNPVMYNDFLKNPHTRTRYWARSTIGWTRLRQARPNLGHFALAKLETKGFVTGVITQNVDRLHHAAGSRRVLELHGALAKVRCLSCDTYEIREQLQERLLAQNPNFKAHLSKVAQAPDGDASLPDDASQGFRVPDCQICGGVLKPDVVFFGESVPRPLVERAFSLVDKAEVLLVLGSSLTVFSGYRFVSHAFKQKQPIAICNLGPTRGDAHAQVKLEAPLGKVLPALVKALLPA